MAKQKIVKELVRFDWFIKHLLRDKVDFEILEGFLSELLKEDITILEILESESNPMSANDKFNRVDILVKTINEERVIIEVQNTKELDYLQRVYYGASKTLVETVLIGQAYKNIKRIISVSVVYFELGQGEDYIYVGTTSFKGMHNNDNLKLSKEQIEFFANPNIRKVEDIFANFYLIRALDFDENIKNGLDEWVYFFKKAQVKGNIKAKGLAKALKRLEVSKLKDKDRNDYKRYLESLRSDASYEAQMKFEVANAVEEVRAEITAQVKEEVTAEITAQVKEEVTAEITAQVKEEVTAQVRAEVKAAAAKEVVEAKAAAVKEAAEAKITIAKIALAEGANVDFVAKITGFSIEEVVEIKEKMKIDRAV